MQINYLYIFFGISFFCVRTQVSRVRWFCNSYTRRAQRENSFQALTVRMDRGIASHANTEGHNVEFIRKITAWRMHFFETSLFI